MSENTAPTPSQSDINFMIQIFQHMTEKPAIDWQSFADAAGFKNTTVAHTRWGQIKRKFNNSTIQTTPKKAASKASPSTPGSTSKVKKAAGRVGAKANKGKNAVKAEADAHDEEEDEKAVDSPIKAECVKFEDTYI
ncbi:uncharacterized protein LY79DRAFT_682075 [Colletotrichum navitas]|uniref:Myb-like DNA-binding domain-containing protein n=1 Tax=Colletotrichum navitas TaxID=681940 RepID=A0AAD8V802_9PEZI|nr:uncharacterized protein LY79DRAFT_682075 [Colletotrichum navitas]KAK1594965.1 hypothetical protein LY79DRAFT_682075 [Colletotrichum navitas]